MKKKLTILGFTLALLGFFIWRAPYIFEWNYNRRWKQIPIAFQGDLMRFESDCSNRYSRIFGVPPLNEPPIEIAEQINLITNCINTSNIELNSYFDLSTSTPYFFKCRCSNYLLIWHNGSLDSPKGNYVIARITDGDIRNFSTVFKGEPDD